MPAEAEETCIQPALIMRDKSFEQTQEDIFRERALVLARAGESVHDALLNLNTIGQEIEQQLERFNKNSAEPSGNNGFPATGYALISHEHFFHEINSKIARYNKMRNYAKLRYYYLIVTREALGLRRHKTVEEIYKIPPKKEYIDRR